MKSLKSKLTLNQAVVANHRNLRFGTAILVSVSLVLASAAVVATSASAAPSGQLIIANGEPITAAYYDPHSAFGLVDAQLGSLVFDTLLMMDKNGKLSPSLASSYKRVSKTQVNVVVRTGVNFHDGSALTPADVAASINRVIIKDSPLAFALLGAPGKATVDGNTVEIVTDKPFGALENSLAVIAIVPSADINKPDNWKIKPNGTGPYSFISNKNNDLTVTAFAGYWGTQPLIKTVILRYIEDTQARQSALLTGQVDMSTRVGPQQIKEVKGNSDFNVFSNQGPPSQIISIWTDRGPLKDPALRRAISYAIDRKTINTVIQGKMNNIAYNGMPTNMPFYKDASEKYSYNPNRAKSLLKTLGLYNKLTLTMSTSSLVPKQAEIDQAIVGYLKDVGVKVKLTQLEVGKFRTTYSDYDMSLNTIATFNNDPSFALGIYAGGIGKAVFQWDDAKFNALFAAQRDDAGSSRAAKVNAAQTYLWNQARTLWVSDENWVFIVNKRVKNYTRAPLVGEALITTASVTG